MKGAIACFVSAVARFLKGGEREWRGSICVLITGDEEGPAINGTRKVLRWMVENGESIDVCLVGEPTNPENVGDMIKVGRRGSMVGRLSVEGIQGHAAYPHLADNPVPRLVAMLRILTETALDDGNEHFEPSTIAVTSVDVGNPAANVIPASARAIFNHSVQRRAYRRVARGVVAGTVRRGGRGCLHAGGLGRRRGVPGWAGRVLRDRRGRRRTRTRRQARARYERRDFRCPVHQGPRGSRGIRSRRDARCTRRTSASRSPTSRS